jgi:hypothetical protein
MLYSGILLLIGSTYNVAFIDFFLVKYPKDKVVIFAVDDTFMQTYFTKIWAYTGKS